MYFGLVLKTTGMLLLLPFLCLVVHYQNDYIVAIMAGLVVLCSKLYQWYRRYQCNKAQIQARNMNDIMKMARLVQLQPNEGTEGQLVDLIKLPFIVVGCRIELNYANYFLNYFEENDYRGPNRWKSFHFKNDLHLALSLKDIKPRDWHYYVPNVAATVFLMYYGEPRTFEDYRDTLLDLTDGFTITDGVRLAIVVEGCKDDRISLTNGDIMKRIQYDTIVERLGPKNVRIFRTCKVYFGRGYDDVLEWIRDP